MADERAAPRFGEDKYILGHGVRWSIAYPLGHDPATRRPLYHRKSIHGPKRDAQAYRDWYADLMFAGQAPTETISQSELQELAHLQAQRAAPATGCGRSLFFPSLAPRVGIFPQPRLPS